MDLTQDTDGRATLPTGYKDKPNEEDESDRQDHVD